MILFEAKNIHKKYANHVALNDVSIAVPEKSIFGLLGPNGAGKTSLIRIINQITAPDSGELFFDGKPLAPHHVEQIGYLPEERGLYKKMEVGEQALYLARLKGLSRRDALTRLKFWFEKFEIQPWWKKKVEELSKGMQQKVQFIVTVLHEPRLLILDEPFSGFDPINASLIKNEILGLRDNGATILFSTHNMESVEELCNDIALINNSRNILAGSVRDIRNQFKSNTYEIIFDGSTESFDAALQSLQISAADYLVTDDHHLTCKLTLANGHGPNEILKAIIPVATIHSFREKIPGMNDIFIRKVNEKQ